MTNEEKVQELAICYTQYDSNEDVNIVDVVGALRDMAKWKDTQFKAYLEKKRKKYTTGLSVALQKNATQEAVVNDKIQCLLNEIINELFKED